MADIPRDTRPPPAAPEQREDKEAAAELRRGVQRQRQHIKDLTGEDPLRGGVAD